MSVHIWRIYFGIYLLFFIIQWAHIFFLSLTPYFPLFLPPSVSLILFSFLSLFPISLSSFPFLLPFCAPVLFFYLTYRGFSNEHQRLRRISQKFSFKKISALFRESEDRMRKYKKDEFSLLTEKLDKIEGTTLYIPCSNRMWWSSRWWNFLSKRNNHYKPITTNWK